ncbi:MAG: hypothetical protein NXI32_18545 [bacterium]|nr:hypothetical protein [bacterium]
MPQLVPWLVGERNKKSIIALEAASGETFSENQDVTIVETGGGTGEWTGKIKKVYASGRIGVAKVNCDVEPTTAYSVKITILPGGGDLVDVDVTVAGPTEGSEVVISDEPT